MQFCLLVHLVIVAKVVWLLITYTDWLQLYKSFSLHLRGSAYFINLGIFNDTHEWMSDLKLVSADAYSIPFHKLESSLFLNKCHYKHLQWCLTIPAQTNIHLHAHTFFTLSCACGAILMSLLSSPSKWRRCQS